MGTFFGHSLTGSFVFAFGTWWAFAAWSNYVRSRENKNRYLCRCTYAIPCLPRQLSLEGIVKIVSCSVCIASEFTATFKKGRIEDMESAQHQSMYVFFLLSGVVDVLYNFGFPLPRHADYVVLLLALAAEGLLFHFHLQGRPHLDAMIHTLLVYTAAAIVACLIAEMCRPRSILASLGRAYFSMLQGTWLWQIAIILYKPWPGHVPWDVMSHRDSMLAASLFAWHMMALLVYVGVLGALAWAVNRMCGRFCKDVVSVDAEEFDDIREALIKRGS